MRNGLKYLIAVSILWCSMIIAQAASISTSIAGGDTIEAGGEITLTFSFVTDEPIRQLDAKLNFDSDLLEIVGEHLPLNGLNVTLSDSGDVTVTSAAAMDGSVSFMQVTLRAKEAFAIGDTASISLSEVSVILVQSENIISGTSAGKTITAAAPKSDNNYLKNLYTNSGSIDFDRNTFQYALTVDHTVDRIRIVAIKEDPDATVKEDAMYDLRVYQNVINIVVTAQNGSKRTYTINVIRRDSFGNTSLLSSNTELKSLSVEGYSVAFSPSVLEYRLTVGNIVDNVLVLAQAADDRSSVIIDNVSLLQLGENRIQVTVVAPNGQSRIYTIFVVRSLEAPQVTLTELEDIIYQTTATVIPVILEDDYILSAEVLDKVRKASKILDIQKQDDQGKLLYRWTIDGRSLTAKNDLDLRLRLNYSQLRNLDDLFGESRYWNVYIVHQGEIPVGTIVKVYIGGIFPDLSTLNLYHSDPAADTLILNSQSVRMDGGYVEFEVLSGGEYILSDALIRQDHPLDFVLIGALVVIFMLIVALSALLFSRRPFRQT